MEGRWTEGAYEEEKRTPSVIMKRVITAYKDVEAK
jgi:hypothetical protein